MFRTHHHHVWLSTKLGPIMGCTSSAPSMAPANATEKNITFSDDTQEKKMEEVNEMIGGVTETKAIIENKVLPTCDNLDQPISLSQTYKAMIETVTVSQRIDKDVQTDNFRIDNENVWNDSFKMLQGREKVPQLEEVVENVVEKAKSESNSESARSTPEPSPELADEIDTEETSEAPADEAEAEVEANYEHLEEAISPTQSESSRATRWEALADIAAELPPSLAVDPLTGQIYTLK